MSESSAASERVGTEPVAPSEPEQVGTGRPADDVRRLFGDNPPAVLLEPSEWADTDLNLNPPMPDQLRAAISMQARAVRLVEEAEEIETDGATYLMVDKAALYEVLGLPVITDGSA